VPALLSAVLSACCDGLSARLLACYDVLPPRGMQEQHCVLADRALHPSNRLNAACDTLVVGSRPKGSGVMHPEKAASCARLVSQSSGCCLRSVRPLYLGRTLYPLQSDVQPVVSTIHPSLCYHFIWSPQRAAGQRVCPVDMDCFI
jgi:hypothetical protein